MIALKLAFRNLIGAGLRTWLTVIVLSMSYVVIIWNQGLLEGWNRQVRRDTIAWEIGGGQIWHKDYDRYDPFTLSDSHRAVPEAFKERISNKTMAPILVTQATIYPGGRIRSVLLKGIDPGQTILRIPSHELDRNTDEIPALIGSRTARSNNLKAGDSLTIRWRNVHGTFDAAEAIIAGVFQTNVPTVDSGQIWLPLERLRAMMEMPNEATLFVLEKGVKDVPKADGWAFQGYDVLLAEIDRIVKRKTIGGSIMYGFLLLLALLAIFDTQVLAVFRRQKEIGTHIALGMTRAQVVGLFTLEGAMHGVLAVIVAAVYGIPFLSFQAVRGFAVPQTSEDYGLAVAERIFPTYGAGLVIATVLIVLVSTTLVSYFPARRITRMKPTDALKGRIR